MKKSSHKRLIIPYESKGPFSLEESKQKNPLKTYLKDDTKIETTINRRNGEKLSRRQHNEGEMKQ